MRSSLQLAHNINYHQRTQTKFLLLFDVLSIIVWALWLLGNRPSVRTLRLLLHCADYPRGIAVIAVSSPHRKEAFTASEGILEEVKQKAQIWKREYYEGEDENDAEWKENT